MNAGQCVRLVRDCVGDVLQQVSPVNWLSNLTNMHTSSFPSASLTAPLTDLVPPHYVS